MDSPSRASSRRSIRGNCPTLCGRGKSQIRKAGLSLLGLGHLVTHGPLAVYVTLELPVVYAAWGAFSPIFVFLYAVIMLCLYVDARDLLLHMAGQPFSCYIRNHQRLGHLELYDERANAPVTMFSRILW